ncbi:MAG: transcriptional regulator AraC family [Comamonadaceae bacterium]|nr:MAG: transcriptional regulator AraC family [Comamonadaceae bacterium]
MNPDELHTGRAETTGGWRYHMLYIDPAVLADLTGEPAWWFTDAVVTHSQAQAQRVSQLLEALWQAEEPLAFDSLLHRVMQELRPHARVSKPLPTDKRMRFAPVLDYLHAHFEQRLTLNDLAQVAGLSPFHFLRQFQAQVHVTPQQMLMAVRLFEAKRLLATGQAPAMVAASTGLTDQAHLTRAFARRYGVTPARYQQQLGLK